MLTIKHFKRVYQINVIRQKFPINVWDTLKVEILIERFIKILDKLMMKDTHRMI